MIESKQDANTDTCLGKLSLYNLFENDEMYSYIELTELLIKLRPKPKTIIKSIDTDNKDFNLRKSLFAHVPPYIVFQNKSIKKLPPEITKYLLWWHPKSHCPQIISSMVQNSGFKTTSNSMSNWCGTWCSRRAYSGLEKGCKIFSKVNHFHSSVQLSDKILLWTNIRRIKRKCGRKCFDFVPLTFILPQERYYLKKFIQKNGGIWIVKPPASCAGQGIKLVSHLYEVPNEQSLVAQRYISNPRLINGIKFDIRLYVLLTSIDPLRIYLYKEGLVRLATTGYINHVSTLSDKFMHLTNTSINKVSPNFKRNDDPNKCEGNMWSLSCLWKYLTSIENIDTCKIWTKIQDIVIKTVISVEPSLVKAWRKTSLPAYNFYQLFGFDVLLDNEYRPWLLEVNDFPSMEPDTPLCRIVKGQLANDCFNLVGFHVPNILTRREVKMLRAILKENSVCYNGYLYSNALSWKDRRKQYVFSRVAKRKGYINTILNSLTPDDVRVLIRHEDEVSQTGRFEKIFPTQNTYKYFEFLNEVRYYNMLLDAWENETSSDRSKGIDRLRKLCRKKYHLS